MRSPKPVVAVAIPTIGRETIAQIMTNVQADLASHGFQPRFFIGTTREGEKAHALIADEMRSFDVKYAYARQGTLGATTMAAVNAAAKENPFAILVTDDDYMHESKHGSRLIEHVQNGKDAVFGAWDRDSMKTFPIPQMLNERGTSNLVMFANPAFHPQTYKVGATPVTAFARGQRFEAYTGFYAFTPRAWKRMKRGLALFQENKHLVKGAGMQVAIALASLHQNLKVSLCPIPRRFEHPIPVTLEESNHHRQTRLLQFDHATRIVQEFLHRTGQSEKIEPVEEYAQRMRQRIREAPIRRGYTRDSLSAVKSSMPAE